MSISEVTDSSFKKEVINSPSPVLVDFWAPWCGPCRMIGPIIEEISKEYQDTIKVVQINTDESPTIATEYAIRSIPTVMIFINGKKVDSIIGAVPKATLTGILDSHLGNLNK
uniref:Thioredoxin n=1 Tax=Wrangelia sp. TaxID=2575620 RepID=A0A4D6X1H2_9FLOR|nr:Thioredoxin [Wrangelia sp.]